MNKLKRLLASVLSVVIIFSIPLESFAAIESDGNQSVFSQDEEITEEEKSLFENDENIAIDELATDYSSVALNNDDVSVTGTDSLGRLLGEAFSDKASEQIENSGYNIFSVEIEGNTAVVEFETLQDAILVVAVYEEDGIRLLGTGKSPVLADSESVNITIDVDLMPKYFYIRSFLILSDSLEPLCPMYESAKYTQEMQEFLAMTTDDFDKSLVMNLDEDKNNNFLIYKENVVRIDESDVVNVLVSADEEALQYVFDKIDDQISGL